MASTAPVLEHANVDPEIDLGHSIRAAVADHGKSVWSQIKDMWRLRFGPGRLQPDEYYYYRLYDDRRFSHADKTRFLGKATWDRIYRRCNTASWWAIAHDKLVFYAVLQGQGLPAPETRAIYHRHRRLGAAPVLTEPAALAAFLRHKIAYPFFGKPVTGIRSVGVAAVDAHDRAGDALILRDGRSVGIEAFVREIEGYRADGYLFQEMLRPHAELDQVCGGRLSTVRLIVLLEEAGPTVLHALWKVPVGANPADNFWRPGNLLAALEPTDGRVRRVIQGVGPKQIEVERHPDTDQPLKGRRLPDWQPLVALGLEAATAFPGLRLQAWDIALTTRGPVLVEVNIGGDFNLPQLALAAGLMDERFRHFLDSCR